MTLEAARRFEAVTRIVTRRRARARSRRARMDDARDALDALLTDARAQRALADDARCFPECRESRARSKSLREIVAACEARPRLGVTDARTRFNASRATADATHGARDDDDLDGMDLGDGAGVGKTTTTTTTREVERERATTRDEDTGTKLWMTCDGIVFVVTAEASMGERGGGREAKAKANAPATSEDATTGEENEKTTQWPEPKRRNEGGSGDKSLVGAVKALRGTRLEGVVDEIASNVERLGASGIFVVCERVGDSDNVRASKIRDALVKLTGVVGNNVFCVPEGAREGLSAVDGGHVDAETGGWFSGSSGKKTVAKDFQLRLDNWQLEWRNSRAKKLRNAEYEAIRQETQFWAMFLRKDDEWLAEEREREEAGKKDNEADAKGDEVSADGAETSKMDKVDKESLARVHETASLLAIHKFLKTAIEGVPMAGIPGAPEMAWKHFQKYPEPERAPLMNAVYSHNVIQYAAALMFAWLTPGPVGAHATHFMNRFRISLFFVCLCGSSPLDPTVITTAIALAAGTDKENLQMSPVIRFMKDDVESEVSSEDEASEDEDAKPRMDIDGVVDVKSASTSSLDESWGSLNSMSSLMQDALDRAVAEGNDLKRRASKMLVDFLNSGNRTVLKSRRRAMKAACDAKADAMQQKKMSYDEAEKMAKKVFDREFSRDATKRLTTLIFGPKYFASVTADITQVINSSFTTYIAMSSIDIFLPMVEEHEEKMRLKKAEEEEQAKAAAAAAAAAATAALTTKNGFIHVTLEVEKDCVRCTLTPTPLPTTVEKLLSTSKIISEKTVALTASTAEAVSSSAEAVSTWASKTTDSVRKETNRGLELAQENAKASIESAKSGLENVGAFFDRTKTTLNSTITSSATSITTVFSSLKTGGDASASDGKVSIDVRSLPVQRIAAALENEEVDRVIADSNLVLKMPADLILSKALGDIYKEVRADASAFVKYKDDETVLRAIQRLLELVVESGDEVAINELIKLGVVPRPKSAAQAKLEAWRENFRKRESEPASAIKDDAKSSEAAETPPPSTASKIIPEALRSAFAAPLTLFSRASASAPSVDAVDAAPSPDAKIAVDAKAKASDSA
jgi:hypothetical protein